MTRQLDGQMSLPLGSSLTTAQRRDIASHIETDWQHQAACAGREGDVWFPGDADADAANRARHICKGCPVLRACRAAGLLGDEHGVWGGMTRAERQVVADRLRYGTPVDLALDRAYPVPAVTTGHDQDEGAAA